MRYADPIGVVAITAALLLAAAGARPAVAPLPRDERLDTPVTIALQDRFLEDALRELSPRGGPRLTTAPPPPTSWAPGWDRVTVCAKERPLRGVLDGLAELLNYRWQSAASDERPSSYHLSQTSDARRYEEQLWQDLIARSAEPLIELSGYTRKPPAEWAKVRGALREAHPDEGDPQPDDPLLRQGNLDSLSSPQGHAALELFTTLTPPQRLELLDRESLFLPYAGMTARQQELARIRVASYRTIDDHERQLSEEESQRQVDQQLARLERYGIYLTMVRNPGTGALSSYTVRFGPYVGGGAYFNDPLFEASLLPVRGRPYRTPGERRPTPSGAGPNRPEGTQRPAPLYPDLAKLPFPPAFRLDRKRSPTWSEIVAELARRLPMPLFSDDFAGTRDWARLQFEPLPDLSRLSLAEGLDALCKFYDKCWWKQGEALYFRSRAWFYEKQYEVPPPLLARLAEQIDPDRGLTSAALTTLSRLTLKQLQGLSAAAAFATHRRGDSTHGRSGWFHYAGRAYPLLRFFGSLSEAQQRQALVFYRRGTMTMPELRHVSALGLRPDQMTEAQREQFLFLAILSDTQDVLDDPAKVRFQVSAGPPQRPLKDGEPWIVSASVSCRDDDGGSHSPLAVAYTPPERKRPGAGRQR